MLLIGCLNTCFKEPPFLNPFGISKHPENPPNPPSTNGLKVFCASGYKALTKSLPQSISTPKSYGILFFKIGQ